MANWNELIDRSGRSLQDELEAIKLRLEQELGLPKQLEEIRDEIWFGGDINYTGSITPVLDRAYLNAQYSLSFQFKLLQTKSSVSSRPSSANLDNPMGYHTSYFTRKVDGFSLLGIGVSGVDEKCLYVKDRWPVDSHSDLAGGIYFTSIPTTRDFLKRTPFDQESEVLKQFIQEQLVQCLAYRKLIGCSSISQFLEKNRLSR